MGLIRELLLFGTLGVGTTTPGSTLEVVGTAPNVPNGSILAVDGNSLLTSTTNAQFGISSLTQAAPGSASTQSYVGGQFISGSAINTNNISGGGLRGMQGGTYYSGTGTIGVEEGGMFQNQLVAAGTVTTAIGVHIANPTKTAGTIGTNYGLYVDSQTAGTANYAAVFQGGNVGYRDNVPE